VQIKTSGAPLFIATEIRRDLTACTFQEVILLQMQLHAAEMNLLAAELIGVLVQRLQEKQIRKNRRQTKLCVLFFDSRKILYGGMKSR